MAITLKLVDHYDYYHSEVFVCVSFIKGPLHNYNLADAITQVLIT